MVVIVAMVQAGERERLVFLSSDGGLSAVLCDGELPAQSEALPRESIRGSESAPCEGTHRT